MGRPSEFFLLVRSCEKPIQAAKFITKEVAGNINHQDGFAFGGLVWAVFFSTPSTFFNTPKKKQKQTYRYSHLFARTYLHLQVYNCWRSFLKAKKHPIHGLFSDCYLFYHGILNQHHQHLVGRCFFRFCRHLWDSKGWKTKNQLHHGYISWLEPSCDMIGLLIYHHGNLRGPPNATAPKK